METQSATHHNTRITFDLADELTPEEIRKFQQSAKEAGAPSLKEHFLNITLRLPDPSKEADCHKEAA